MEKIAIISDVHGNLEALNTVLKDIKKRNITRIFCLGDIIGKGSFPHECIKIIKDNCEVVLIGNNDDAFTANKSGFELKEVDLKRLEWNQSLITEEDKNYLANLPYSFEFYMSGSLIRLFHATPTKLDGFCASYNDFNLKYEMFLPSKNTISDKRADVVIYGHRHTSYVEKLFNRTLINIGSVGNNVSIIRSDARDAKNQETTRASYLIIEGDYGAKEYKSSFSYQFVDIPYNIEKELANIKPNFESDIYKLELTEGKFRNMTRVYNQLRANGINPDEFENP
ncbi:MAG: metallophosphatase family protein [Bacilli bacterium]|nr:metallophosphatase family protein [Bacilli bacterium]